ncbi:MAG: hypothetical protein EOP00_22935 [Pedobacter sp.]|nr:MAG: hypothetical protein EOP00_22935 [Pedobacter sp.]
MEKLILLLIFVSSIKSIGQHNCNFKIDEAKILNNKNLDFFLNRFDTSSFEIVNEIKYIPPHIYEELKCLNGEFTMANPNEKFRDSDIIENEKLPSRGLIFFAQNENTLILYYGMSIGSGITSKFLFVDYDSKKINDIWIGNGIGKGNFQTLEAIKNHITFYREKPFFQTGIVNF